MKGQLILEKLIAGDTAILDMLYKKYRPSFIVWLEAKYGCPKDLGVDIFQETMLAFYSNVRQGKLTQLNSSLKTYLYAIGRNVYTNHKNQQKLTTLPLSDIEDYQHFDTPSDKDLVQLAIEKEKAVLEIVRSLGPPCQPILFLYYYQRYSIKKIRESLAYKNDAVVKNMKSRCLKNLRSKVAQTLTKQ